MRQYQKKVWLWSSVRNVQLRVHWSCGYYWSAEERAMTNTIFEWHQIQLHTTLSDILVCKQLLILRWKRQQDCRGLHKMLATTMVYRCLRQMVSEYVDFDRRRSFFFLYHARWLRLFSQGISCNYEDWSCDKTFQDNGIITKTIRGFAHSLYVQLRLNMCNCRCTQSA